MFPIQINSQTLETELIGYFSVDGDLEYRADLSQLKYYIPPSDPNNVNFDLNVNFEPIHPKPSHPKLYTVLKWISDNFHRIERPSAQNGHW